MNEGFIGTATASMTPWYWIAVGSSIVLALLLRSIPLARWREWRQLRQLAGGLVLVSGLLVLTFLTEWQTTVSVIAALVIQFAVHWGIQQAWGGKHDMGSWLRRYEWLPGIIIVIPIYAWWQVISPEEFLFEGPELSILLILLIMLYVSGLVVSNLQWSRNIHVSRSIKTLYLCALELTPLLWVAKANL